MPDSGADKPKELDMLRRRLSHAWLAGGWLCIFLFGGSCTFFWGDDDDDDDDNRRRVRSACRQPSVLVVHAEDPAPDGHTTG